MGRLSFCFVVLPLLAVGLAVSVWDLVDYIRTGNISGVDRKPVLFWPVHLCFTVFMGFNLFVDDPVTGFALLALQSSCMVPMALMPRWSDRESLLYKSITGLSFAFTASVVFWSLFRLMGHGKGELMTVWKLYYCWITISSFVSYMHASLKGMSVLCREGMALLYARELVFVSAFFLTLAVMTVSGLMGGGAVSSLSVSVFSLLSVAYLHLAYIRSDDLYLMRHVKMAVSSSLPVSLLDMAAQDAVPSGDGGDGEGCQRQYDASLKDRFEEYFKSRKPFLNPNLSLNDMAVALCTNKTYLSRMLNNGLGMNFSQVVNKYRVAYCMELFVKNPYLKLADLSDAAGFRSLSTFSLAFRLNTGEAPGDWCRRTRSRLRQSVKDPVIVDG